MDIDRRKSINRFTFMLILQLIIYYIVFLNIPIARQIIGFIYFTFIPGFILIKVLKLDKLDFSERILLSVGLSIAFLMFIGLLMNVLGLLIGVSTPLSLIPLMIILNIVMFLLYFPGYLTNKNFKFSVPENLKLSPVAFLFISLPLLSVVGTILVNDSGDNSVLLLMVIMISIVIVLCTLSKKLVPPQFYPLALLMISIALLFHRSLISNYIYGADIHVEYYIFKLTENASRWSSTVPSTTDPLYNTLNAMLSITVLPSIYSTILNIRGTWILKILYPLIFSFVPLGLYHLYRTRVSRKIAFLSAFFFMANSVFFTEMLWLARQMVAELFFVLLLFVLLNKKMNGLSRWTCFVIFGAALIVSHYAATLIFLFLIFLTWLFLFLMKRTSRQITTIATLLFFVMMFSWYIFTSSSGAFDALLTFGNNLYNNLANFFNPSSRGVDVLRGLGIEPALSFWHSVGRIFAYGTEFLIVVGFIGLMIKRKMFDPEYVVLTSLNMVLLAMSIILPNFAVSLRMTRLYHVLLFFLAPLCIMGGKFLFSFILKTLSLTANRNILNLKTEFPVLVLSLILVILIPFFLFQTEFVYVVAGDYSYSVALNKNKMGLALYGQGFVDEQDVFGAKWLWKNIDVESTPIYADVMSKSTVLTSYGMVIRDRIDVLSNTTMVLTNGTVYLRWINVLNGTIFGDKYAFNVSDISPILNNMNLVYSNGDTEIYTNTENFNGTNLR